MFGHPGDEGTHSARKRRRPALSCIECRRRKIKCDRNSPCNHCKQMKNTPCVYKDLHTINPNRRLSGSKGTLTPKLAVDISNEAAGSVPYINGVPYTHELSYRLPSQDSSPQTAPVIYDSSPDNGSSISIATTINEPHTEIVQTLAERLGRSDLDAMTATAEEIDGTRWQKALGLSFSTFNDVIVEDGFPGSKLRTKFFNQTDSTPIRELKGSTSKTRFFGQSHWMNSLDQFDRTYPFRNSPFLMNNTTLDEANAEVRRLLEKCKTEARKIKSERSVKWHMNPDFKDYMPPRETSDRLVQLYLRTMESTHRILHIPQFLREYEGYWNNPERVPVASIVKILLVMSIGACFYQEADYEAIHSSALQWVYSAQSWVSAPFEKGRLNYSGLQIQCLLILARQTTPLGGDLMWVATGNLVRSAFQLGFHRDPKWFPKISVMHAELRRRLWATIMEMAVQASLDTGMPPLLTVHDFDTGPPSNLDDEDISETTTVLPTPKAPHVFTQASLQIQLFKSLPSRLLISNNLNGLNKEITYNETLVLGNKIAEACRENAFLIQSYPPSLPHPTPLQRNLQDIILRRFLIAVHHLFAVNSRTEPRYYFSRKVCIDTAMTIMSHSGRDPSSPPPLDSTGKEIMDDFTRLCCVGGGFYKDILVHSGIIVCMELILQLEEDIASGMPSSAAAMSAREPLLKVIHDMYELLTKRIELGENNVKGILFVALAQGQVEALMRGTKVDEAVIGHAKKAVQTCLELLRARTKTPETPPDAAIGPLEVWQPGMYTGEQDMGYDFLMQDGGEGGSSMSNFNFDIPDSWLFTGWGDNNPTLH